ncbi:unnamed protein product, partial [Rotaria sp. Silwood2]
MSQDNNNQPLPNELADRLDIYEMIYDFQKKNQKDVKQELKEAKNTGNQQLIEEKQIQYKNEIEKSRIAAEVMNDGVQQDEENEKTTADHLSDIGKLLEGDTI